MTDPETELKAELLAELQAELQDPKDQQPEEQANNDAVKEPAINTSSRTSEPGIANDEKNETPDHEGTA